MPNTQTVGAKKSYGLDELNQWIAEQEQILGPIVELADGTSATAGVFDLGKPRLKKNFARAALKVGQTCVVDNGHTLIGEGQAYIAGVLTEICLSRPR
jgi:hypothetical protein